MHTLVQLTHTTLVVEGSPSDIAKQIEAKTEQSGMFGFLSYADLITGTDCWINPFQVTSLLPINNL